MAGKFKRLALLPILVANCYSLYGVLFLDWSVADLFFWFWCEFVLAGMTTFALMQFWRCVEKDIPGSFARMGTFLFGFLLILFYATLFAAMAYGAEWGSWNRFPEFLADKKTALLAMILSFAAFFGMTLARRDYGLEDSNRITLQFGRRAWVVLGLYAILMFHYHFTGAPSLNLSRAYLECMGVILIALKLLAEAGLFDRFFKRRHLNRQEVK